MRYKIVEGSQSAHCCFVATVVDTKYPYLIGGKQYKDHYEEVCECFSMADAEKIVNALNKGEK